MNDTIKKRPTKKPDKVWAVEWHCCNCDGMGGDLLLFKNKENAKSYARECAEHADVDMKLVSKKKYEEKGFPYGD